MENNIIVFNNHLESTDRRKTSNADLEEISITEDFSPVFTPKVDSQHDRLRQPKNFIAI